MWHRCDVSRVPVSCFVLLLYHRVMRFFLLAVFCVGSLATVALIALAAVSFDRAPPLEPLAQPVLPAMMPPPDSEIVNRVDNERAERAGDGGDEGDGGRAKAKQKVAAKRPLDPLDAIFG